MPCEHKFTMSPECGAFICDECHLHVRINSQGEVFPEYARCFCGWAASGGDGVLELLDRGEVI